MYYPKNGKLLAAGIFKGIFSEIVMASAICSIIASTQHTVKRVLGPVLGLHDLHFPVIGGSMLQVGFGAYFFAACAGFFKITKWDILPYMIT